MKPDRQRVTRREFLRSGSRGAALVGLGVDDLEWAGVLASLLASAAWTVACWTLARRLTPAVSISV